MPKSIVLIHGRFPTSVDRWVNITAHDDVVAHDADAGDDFTPMVRQGCVREIVDPPKIHTFWAGHAGSNPHKLYGYLNHPAVAAHVVEWLQG